MRNPGIQNLIQLLTTNAKRPRNWSIKAEGDEATVYIYDVIGGLFGGVDAEEIARDLANMDAKRINLRINSPGGDVFDGRAIYTALRQHPAEVVAQVDGVAASAASTIAMGADRIEMAPGSFLMIHNAWTLGIGNKGDLRQTADLLEKIDGAIVADYVNRTGASTEQVTQWMDAETWFTPEEAKEHGFADAISESPKSAGNHWNLSAYQNAPQGLIQQSAENEPPRPDRAQMERRLALLERIAA